MNSEQIIRGCMGPGKTGQKTIAFLLHLQQEYGVDMSTEIAEAMAVFFPGHDGESDD